MGKTKVNLIILAVVFLSLSSGLGYRVDDFRVDDTPPPSLIGQIHLASDGKGKFAVSWLDASYWPPGVIYLRVYAIEGTLLRPTLVIPNVVDSGQVLENVRDEFVLLPNGNFVFAKTVEKDSVDEIGQIYAFGRGYIGIFDSLGKQLLPYFRGDSLPPTGDTRFIEYAGIACDSQGSFTVLMRTSQNTSDLYFQQFFADGQKRGQLTQVDDCVIPEVCGIGLQGMRITMNPDGSFGVNWDNLIPAVRFFKPDGTPVGEVLIPTCDDSLPRLCTNQEPTCLLGTGVHMDMDDKRSFAVAFNGCNGLPYRDNQPYVRILDSLGTPLTPNIKVDDLDTSWSLSSKPKVSVMNDSEYVVIWLDRGYDPSAPDGDIYLKRYKLNGKQTGIKYKVNNPYSVASSHEHTRIAVCDSHLIIVWRDNRNAPGLLTSVYAQIMPLEDVGFYTPGDVNYDNTISLADVIGMVNFFFKGKPYGLEGSTLVCDVNGDCKVTLSDVIYLVNYIFKPNWPSPVGCPM
jgi:hypothetical protein